MLLAHEATALPYSKIRKALYDGLRTLMADQVVTYQEGNHSEQVIVDQIQFSPEQLSPDADWWEGTCIVRLLTVP